MVDGVVHDSPLSGVVQMWPVDWGSRCGLYHAFLSASGENLWYESIYWALV